MKKVLISTFILIFIISMITVVNAATGSISLKASADTVVKGKTFTVTVTGAADNNITGMEASLSYDNTKLSIEDKVAGANFSDLSGNNQIAIGSTSSENLSKSGTLYTITFKVLDTAEEGDTTITVSNAVLALINSESVQENTEESSDEVTITIKADDTTVDAGDEEEQQPTDTQEPTDDEKPEDTKKPTTPSNDKTSSNSNKSTSGSKSNKKTTKLPQTGVETVSVIAIVVLSAISIVSYVSYRKYKNI